MLHLIFYYESHGHKTSKLYYKFTLLLKYCVLVVRHPYDDPQGWPKLVGEA
jgi:hypothetical protein